MISSPKVQLLHLLFSIFTSMAARCMCARSVTADIMSMSQRFIGGMTSVQPINSPQCCIHPSIASQSNMNNNIHSLVQLRGGSSSSSSSAVWRKAHLGVGSNQGSSPFDNISNALSHLQSTGDVKLIRTSFLRKTSPMYMTNQPDFLNGAVEIETHLTPSQLLVKLKQVESDLGRDLSDNAIRNGPRPVDLDILLFDGYELQNDDGTPADTISDNTLLPSGLIMQTHSLEIPHRGMAEREFVLAPLVDLDSNIVHPIQNKTMAELLALLRRKTNNTQQNQSIDKATRVVPLPRGRYLHFNETIIMGILNITPDSFSDGGKYYSNNVDNAVDQAMQMYNEGAHIIDVGGESTRPGADEVGVDEELRRIIPIITRIRQESNDVIISIDTRQSIVAKAAIEAGADIVNDVSGGTHDPNMLSIVASMKVPIILMHMRGNPKTMQSLTNYSEHESVVAGVTKELMQRSHAAEEAGIHRWLQILDPGIGFAKNINGNLSLLKGATTMRKSCNNLPFLFGPSRKGFIGKISGEDNPAERDFGTIAACLAALSSSHEGSDEACNILRVHNVKAVKQAVLVYDAIQNAE